MLYAGTIFLSSFLLFLVQPLIARLILPWFGGSAAVWTTCMLFFQALLVAGYAYAHALGKLGGRRQAIVHSVLLAGALLTLPIAPSAAWKPTGGDEPTTGILLLLGVSVGLPYFVLASTSPLIQLWFSRARPGENPYRLFALSNLASLIALLGYPFAVEPLLAGREQVSGWSWAFVAYAALCALLAWRTPPANAATEATARPPIAPSRYAWWLALSTTGSLLLLAVTNHLTQNVASVPLLWLVPLTLYLLTFIVAFEGRGWYRPRLVWPFVTAALAGTAWLLVDTDLHYRLGLQLGVFLPALFAGCLFCHGELYRLRPPPAQLTAFYLTVAAGGALGGLLVAVVAPVVFDGYYELGIGLAALALLAALRMPELGRLPQLASLAALLGIAACAAYDGLRDRRDVRLAERSFYGVLHVKEYAPGEEGHLRRLVHGTIMHGEQYMHGELRRLITTYYTPSSGIGAAIESKQGHPVKVAVIGLGAGTIAAYGRAGDVYRFYEIDRHVVEIAETQFTFLSDSAARVQIVLGDARLSLESEPPQGFDVLAVDAFSSDAIPVHLITREALGTYLRHMKPDGIVAFHVSNRFLDLVPVVARIAREQNAHAVLVEDDPDEDDPSSRSRSDWVLVSRSERALAAKPIVERGGEPAQDRAEWRTWTDDYSNLIQILK
ncbi:MAG TPA: fused MFS/spermidine synthase [Burkholderiales bacterium]|nr:fused MFS/spermidine synthase [Burkholderiales bacterium]